MENEIKLSKDGNQYCVLMGENLQVGTAGFGETLMDAIEAFDNNIIGKLLKELKKDKSEGSLYYGWQSNIAMAMYDELDGKITNEEANRGAKRFLDNLINIQE